MKLLMSYRFHILPREIIGLKLESEYFTGDTSILDNHSPGPMIAKTSLDLGL